MDGAMGTELIRRGLNPKRERSYDWNTTHPEEVREVHKAYLEAGAVCLLTNSFLAHESSRYDEICGTAVKLVASIDEPYHFVLLDLGPGVNAFLAAKAIALRAPVVCSAMLLETQPSLAWLVSFMERFPAFPEAHCLISFSFTRASGMLVCPKDHSTPETVAEFVHEHRGRFLALGVNCGEEMSMDDIIEVVRRYRKMTDLPILARPNAGTPIRMGDRWVYPHSPKSMAARLPELIDAGATLIGGCCGTTPAHIAAFREVIDRLGVGWEP
jgi:5-methyltetrahydrofolate--homocysteine methyltransferase